MRRLAVIRNHRENPVDAGLRGFFGQLDRVVRIISGRSGDDGRALAERRFDRTEKRQLLISFERGRLAGGAGDDHSVVAAVDEKLRQADGFVDVDRALRIEGRDHRRKKASESFHDPTGAACGPRAK